MYKIGDRICDNKRDIVILDIWYDLNKKEQQYKYKCNKCGYIGKANMVRLEKSNLGCQVCCKNPKIIIPEINSLAAVCPDILYYMEEPNLAYNILAGSHKKIYLRCPHCGYKKLTTGFRFINNGFLCPQCSEKRSYPNRLMFILLKHLNVACEIEKCFEWSQRCRYDFYLPEYNHIIEMQGSQHYVGGFSLPAEQIIAKDELKKKLALANGIQHIIYIDCFKSDFDYIFNNIKRDNFFSKFNLQDLDIEKIKNECRSADSLYNQIKILWLENKTINTIAAEINYSAVWVRNILKELNDLGEVYYNPLQNKRKFTAKIVFDTKTGLEYESLSKAAKCLKMYPNTIKKDARFIIKDCGRDYK